MRRRAVTRIEGLAISAGVAIGRAVCLSDGNPDVLRFQLPEDTIGEELQRFDAAHRAALDDVLEAQSRVKEELGNELSGILGAQAMLLADRALLRRIRKRIRDESINAEWAVLRTCEELEEQFATIETDYLRERGEDLRSVSQYLMRSLDGIAHHEISEIEGDVVVVADELTPADALRLARENVVGFALESGGRTSHTAIVARGLNLPAVFGLDGITDLVTDDTPIVLDGDEGVVVVHPSESTLEDFERRRQTASGLEAELERSTALESVTLDGESVELLANLELLDEIEDAKRFGCVGIGLYRSEFFYLEKSPELPTEEEHHELFSTLLASMAPLPVVVRTLDLGGRKLSRDLMPPEENPVLGLRGIRLTLARPEILETQVRALLRAAVVPEGDLRIMVPLVTTLDEIHAFRSLYARAKQQLSAEGVEYRSDLPLGAMLEVPAAALLARHFARKLDFLSIGTNDLIQYSLAVDRNNEHVADLYQPLHPSVLRLLSWIASEVEGHECELSICGEMAADPVLTPFFLGIGLRRFSMSPRSIPVIKERVRGLEIAGLGETAAHCLELATADEVRTFLLGQHPLPVRNDGVSRA